MATHHDVRVEPVRVVVADDAEDLRVLLRLQFDRDPRFEVVGEATDGYEAIELASAEQPDLIVLDQHMPSLGGLEALPEIRRVSPQTSIVLFTVNAGPSTYQAALDAGAVEVLEKAGPGRTLVDRLVDALVHRGPEHATVEVRVGPIPSSAACVWIVNTRRILDAVEAHPEVVGEAIPCDVLALFRSFLDQWQALADTSEEFRWVARADPVDVKRIVEHWATIDAMTDAQLDRLGIQWTPPEGQPFFQALTTGVLEALRRHEETQRLASLLDEQWAPFRTSDD